MIKNKMIFKSKNPNYKNLINILLIKINKQIKIIMKKK